MKKNKNFILDKDEWQKAVLVVNGSTTTFVKLKTDLICGSF